MKKRMFDLAISVPIAVVIAPTMAIIGMSIVMGSGRPVFSKHPCIGKDGKEFSLFKFRTEIPAPADSPDKNKLTFIGRLLRKASLDELPLLYNIIKGDMSLVGPRPHSSASKARASLLISEEKFEIISSVRPGMTGPAHFQKFCGREKLLEEWKYAAEPPSLVTDLKILGATVLTVHSPSPS